MKVFILSFSILFLIAAGCANQERLFPIGKIDPSAREIGFVLDEHKLKKTFPDGTPVATNSVKKIGDEYFLVRSATNTAAKSCRNDFIPLRLQSDGSVAIVSNGDKMRVDTCNGRDCASCQLIRVMGGTPKHPVVIQASCNCENPNANTPGKCDHGLAVESPTNE